MRASSLRIAPGAAGLFCAHHAAASSIWACAGGETFIGRVCSTKAAEPFQQLIAGYGLAAFDISD
jgi:hypothetical protein